MNTIKLANAFVRILVLRSTPSQMVDIRLKNKTLAYPLNGACPTHDHWDANEIMAEAFEIMAEAFREVHGREMLLPCDEVPFGGEDFVQHECDIVNAAWLHARKSDYRETIL